MTTQCPKCGEDKLIPLFDGWTCNSCFTYSTYYQQSIIEQQQAEISRLRGVLTSIAENEEINTLRYKATLGQILPKVDQGKLAGLLFAAELARKGLGDK
jgi:hypothetical protein